MESTKQQKVKEKLEKLNVDVTEVKVEDMDEFQIEIFEGVQKINLNQESKYSSKFMDWDDERLALTEDIKLSLIDAGILRPCKIEAYLISLVQAKPYKDIVAQYFYDREYMIAYAICALLRVDPEDKNLQIILFAHTRELVS